jgi:hypothetical protein
MASLSRGSYTYGNKSWSQIILITGANVGDTVWDTTYSKRRIWDGYNFVHGSQVSIETTGTVDDGYVVTISSTNDNKIDPETGSGDAECVIGVVEDGKTNTSGDIVTMTYHGLVKARIDSVTYNSYTGYFIYSYTSLPVANGIVVSWSSAGPGVIGHYLDSFSNIDTLNNIIFRPVERS